MYYSLYIGNIFLTIFLIKNNFYLKNFIISLIIITTCLASFENFQRYLSNPAPATLPNTEIEALSFLKNQPSGIVLSYPYDKYTKNNMSVPLPLYAYETTAYISAFSQQTVFLEDEMNLEITGFNWQSQKNESIKFFQSNDEFFARGFLVNHQISYIYLVNGQKFNLNESQLQVQKIFDNSQVQIYQVQR